MAWTSRASTNLARWSLGAYSDRLNQQGLLNRPSLLDDPDLLFLCLKLSKFFESFRSSKFSRQSRFILREMFFWNFFFFQNIFTFYFSNWEYIVFSVIFYSSFSLLILLFLFFFVSFLSIIRWIFLFNWKELKARNGCMK